MATVSRVDREILNSLSDDMENLEQIYRSICLEFSAESYGRTGEGFYWREARHAIPLSDLADALSGLLDRGLVEALLEGHDRPITHTGDRGFLCRAWYRLTPLGRATLSTHSVGSA